MFIFYVFVAALIWAGVSYWLHKNKPLKNAGEVQQVYLIITSISVIIIALIILVFLIYMMASKSLDNLSWAIICILVIAVAALFFKENKI